MDEQGEVPAESAPPDDEFLRLACLDYSNDNPEKFARAESLSATDTDLAKQSVYAAAALGDAAALQEHLRREPSSVVGAGGPQNWPPLLYVVYARIPQHDPVGTVRALLDAGADPNAGFLWEGLCPPFTAVTGVIGRGEQGAHPHPHQMTLLRMLLEAGADANDPQAIYNCGIGNGRPADDTDWLEALLDHGLGAASTGPWYRKLGTQLDEPGDLVAECLHSAARDGFGERVALLLSRGVDPNARGRHPVFGASSALRDAVRHGHAAIAEALEAAGATDPMVTDDDRMLGRLLRGDVTDPAIPRDDLEQVRATHPDLIRRAAELGKTPEILRTLTDLGFDVNARQRATALHEAAFRGNDMLVDALLTLGADPTITDTQFHATAAGWAEHAGYLALATRLG
jgi:hypothetical protein